MSKSEQITEIIDHCAYTIARVYGMYSRFLHKILDHVASGKIQALTNELKKTIEEFHQDDLVRESDLEKIGKWIDDMKVI